MADDNKSGAEEQIARGANMASALRGTGRTGKAASAAAKGAVVGGPLGTAAGALLSNDKSRTMIFTAISLMFALPVLFILMLPSMIFGLYGNLLKGDINSLGASPVMNDTAAIVENIETVGSALNQIMLEALDDLYIRIDHDFAASEGDRMEVTNPYEGSNIIDSNLIIAQYCAAKYKDFDSVTLADMERIVRASKRAIFSYTKQAVTYTYTYEDAETGELTCSSETVIYYTVIYNGATHFADAVFFLDHNQKTIAMDYSHNLHLFLNDNFIISANTTHALLANLVIENPYTGISEAFGSPLDTDWRMVVTSEYGLRTDPITGKTNSGHMGMDFGLALGAPIKTVMSGKVIYVRYPTTGYGYHLAVAHGNNLITLYAHCARILVSEGDLVSKGDIIAFVGSTGRSTGPHLHFEVIEDGKPENPRYYLPG